jgi:cysteine desulfurase
MKQPIYLDNQATTRCDPRVVDAMLPFFSDTYGNSSSVSHSFGQEALQAITAAKQQIAGLIGATDPNCIFFTSGSTESNNIALKSMTLVDPTQSHLVTTAAEHKAILDPAEFLENSGVGTSVLPVDQYGAVNPAEVGKAIQDTTKVVSVIYANNEVGTLNDLTAIGEVCKEKECVLHTDATQAAGKTSINVESQGIDMLSLSGHKIYAPKGIGILYVRRRARGLKMMPLLHGGGHQNKIRSGTLPVALIVGLGKACDLLKTEFEEVNQHCQTLTDLMRNDLQNNISGITFNGHPTERIVGNIHITIEGVKSEALLHLMKDQVALSTGAACTTSAPEPSHVLLSIGKTAKVVSESLRIGIGRFNTTDEVKLVTSLITASVEKLRNI